MMLKAEKDAYRLALVITGGHTRLASVFRKITSAATSRKSRKIVIHVISSLPRPHYLAQLRDVILNNIGYTIIVRYEGSRPEDLARILSQYGPENVDVVLDRSVKEYVSILRRFGKQYETIHMIPSEEVVMA